MRNKLFTLLFAVIAIFSLAACVDTGTTNKPTNPETGEETQNPTGSETKENSVKIKSIDAQETSDVQATYAKAKMRQNRNSDDDANNLEDDINYIIITRPQTDITFTITLDNPEAYGIDALRVYCDDENAQIQVDGEYKPIAKEPDGTRVVNWSSEDPYERTYNIRTTSEDVINSFKVVDVRLAGHDKFQSKETNSTDLGNNELHIYKMDEDAYTLNVIENTFYYIRFNFNIKDEYKDIISNIRVDGLEMDEDGYYALIDSKTIDIVYDYYIEEIGTVQRKENKKIGPYEIVLTTQNNGHKVMEAGVYLEWYFLENVIEDKLPDNSKMPNVFFNMKILDGEGNVVIPEIYTTDGYTFEYIHKSDYDFNDKEHHAYFYYSDFFVGKNVEEMEDIDMLFRFKIGANVYIFQGPWWKMNWGNEIYNIILVEE